ncbi:MAG TPA: MarR family transcriptional regulator [Phototrophicaceae bacterium]|jgi:SOS-response transcriptional repressor LexA|nr:MarR family transcriptional regulator [Phototrophicaceae bacterium]
MPRPNIKPDTRQVYEFIRDFIHHHSGIPPTQREIADGCFIARSAVQRHLDILEARGIIVRTDRMARGIVLADEADLPDDLKKGSSRGDLKS